MIFDALELIDLLTKDVEYRVKQYSYCISRTPTTTSSGSGMTTSVKLTPGSSSPLRVPVLCSSLIRPWLWGHSRPWPNRSSNLTLPDLVWRGDLLP